MSGKIDARLKELGLELPQATAPIANYVPYTVSGNLVVVSGQVSVRGGKPEFVRQARPRHRCRRRAAGRRGSARSTSSRI